MEVLAIDVGITTGWAHSIEGVVTSGNIGEAEFDEGLKRLRSRIGPHCRVVVERTQPMANTPLGERLLELERLTRLVFPLATWIRSAQWKTSPSKHYQVKRGLSQHERDARRIAHWFENTFGRV